MISTPDSNKVVWVTQPYIIDAELNSFKYHSLIQWILDQVQSLNHSRMQQKEIPSKYYDKYKYLLNSNGL